MESMDIDIEEIANGAFPLYADVTASEVVALLSVTDPLVVANAHKSIALAKQSKLLERLAEKEASATEDSEADDIQGD